MSDILLATVTAAVAAATASPAIPGPYNGSLGLVDMAKPVDYTTDYGKVVLTNNNYSLRGTMKYYIYLAQGKPAAATAVTQEHLDVAVPWLRKAIARERIYTVLHRAKVPISFRANDVVPAVTVAQGGTEDRVVDELYRILTNGELMDAKIAKEGRDILLSIIANAIHRKQNNGHSWFTRSMSDPSSLTAKACAVAAENSHEFAAFMRSYGHDINHHLTDDALHEIAMVLVGKDSNAYVVQAATTAAANMYAGADITGKRPSEIFKLPDSCGDRYPPGELGKAAMIVGLSFMEAMLADITGKAKVTGDQSIRTNIGILLAHVKSDNVGRTSVKAIEAFMGPALAFGHGYAQEAGIISTGQYKAFDSHAARYAGDDARGKALAILMKSVAPHPEAVAASVTALVNTIGVAFNGISSHHALGVSNLDTHDPDSLAVEIAENESSRLMKMMARNASSGGAIP